MLGIMQEEFMQIVNLERKIFPGYILIKMQLNEDTWHIIKTTPKLSGFLGS